MIVVSIFNHSSSFQSLFQTKNAVAVAETMQPFAFCSFIDFFRLHHGCELQRLERVADRFKLQGQNKHQRSVKSVKRSLC